jgi:hypothetical protein
LTSWTPCSLALAFTLRALSGNAERKMKDGNGECFGQHQKVDTILDTKRLRMDYEKQWKNSLEFYMIPRHIFPRKCSAILVATSSFGAITEWRAGTEGKPKSGNWLQLQFNGLRGFW